MDTDLIAVPAMMDEALEYLEERQASFVSLIYMSAANWFM